MTQNAAILRHLQTRGPLTPLVALRDYGVFRLAARVKELRNKGVAIETEDVRLPNGKTIASYRLVA